MSILLVKSVHRRVHSRGGEHVLLLGLRLQTKWQGPQSAPTWAVESKATLARPDGGVWQGMFHDVATLTQVVDTDQIHGNLWHMVGEELDSVLLPIACFSNDRNGS